MARLVELRGRSEPGRTRADDSHPLATAGGRNDGLDPTLGKCALYDVLLELLDVDSRVIDGKRASLLARCGTEPPGQLGKVVGCAE